MNTQTNWQDFKCRCSAINQMLSEKQGAAPLTENQLNRIKELDGKEKITEKQKIELSELVFRRDKPKEIVLSDTCIAYLMEHYAWITKRKVSISKEMDIEQFQKGKICEPEGIALLSLVDGVEYSKNSERINNEYLSGEPDIFLGKQIMSANKIIDTKISFDYPCFLKKLNIPLLTANEQQIKGYMDISGALEGEIADVLVDMPETIVNDYRRRLFYKMNVISDESPEYKIACLEMERSMYFGDIPPQLRVFKKKVQPFTDFERQKVYDKVKICREWLFTFDELYNKLNGYTNGEEN